MKKIFILLTLLSIVSCKSQIKINNTYDCEISQTNIFEDFEKIYSKLDTTETFKNTIEDFNKLEKGILLWKFSNGRYSNFTIIKMTENNWVCSRNNKNFSINKNDVTFIDNNIQLINNICYFEVCEKLSESNNTYLIIVKNNKDNISRYFTIGEINLQETENNENFNLIKKFIGIVYRNSSDGSSVPVVPK